MIVAFAGVALTRGAGFFVFVRGEGRQFGTES
jgi:hypothetical protein